ncbi:origin recognition complex subunit 3 [Physcia stellaris]|nr:origin recognition complex subunit 3 [Physcia stellaris]
MPRFMAMKLCFAHSCQGKKAPTLLTYGINASKDVLTEHYTSALNDIASFVEKAHFNVNCEKLPTGLISGAPNVSIQAGLTHAIAQRIRANEDIVYIRLLSTQQPNLKAVLKHINRQAKSQVGNTENQNLAERDHYLNYDLQMLHDHVQNRSIQKVVLYFQDSEGFQETLLADLIEILSSWVNRIPFVLLFGISTSVGFFQEKLSQATLKLLQGTQFEINPLNIDALFKEITRPEQPSNLWLGAGLSRIVLQRHRDHVQTAADFILTIKYIYMTYFYSDPLSILVERPGALDKSGLTFQHEHLEAVRTLPSFKKYASEKLDNDEIQSVRSLLEDDQELIGTLKASINETQKTIRNLVAGIEVLEIVQSCLSLKKCATWPELYMQAIAGELGTSVLMREMLLSVKKISSDSMLEMLTQLSIHLPAMEKLRKDLTRLLSATAGDSTPLRSEHDVHHKILRTTVVAQKVELSKQTAALSKEDKDYSRIVDRVDSALREYSQQTFINPQDLFLHELFIYDAKSPYRDVFTPRPRFAVERALSSPHDYLGCSCCSSAENGLSSTQPATAILYQLYLESGSQINVADLWSAFNTIVGAEDPEDEEADQQRTLALFSQALAELKYLGMIKSSRKKADHLVKLAWKGL